MIAFAQSQPTKAVSESTLPVFGECIELFSTDEFLKQVTENDSRIIVVVHLYDPLIRVEYSWTIFTSDRLAKLSIVISPSFLVSGSILNSSV